jgi:glycerophosphoryl diester phosphodiesterase
MGKLRWLTARPIAHRGLHDRTHGRPENTLAAFDSAAAKHYAIECDLHISGDGIPVVFHDNDLERLTGQKGAVRDCTAAELGDLRILGSREWIPTLDEVLQLVGGRVPLVLELKHVPGRDAGLAFAVAELLRDYPGPAALMSFEPGLIAEVKAADPSLPRGFVAAGRWRTGPRHFREVVALSVDFISYAIHDLPTPMPVIAHRVLGIPLICWTVRTKAELARARRWTDQITFEGFLP